jgi:hypothetical protein
VDLCMFPVQTTSTIDRDNVQNIVARAPVRLSETIDTCIEFDFRKHTCAQMSNPNYKGYEVKVNRRGTDNRSFSSGSKARLFPGGSGAPPGYTGSWQTGFVLSPVRATDSPWIPSMAIAPVPVADAAPSIQPAAVAPPATPPESAPTPSTWASTPSGTLSPTMAAYDQMAITPVPVADAAPSILPLTFDYMHVMIGAASPWPDRSRSPSPDRSRSPPVWVWSSPSTPITPERAWGKRSVSGEARSSVGGSADASTFKPSPDTTESFTDTKTKKRREW